MKGRDIPQTNRLSRVRQIVQAVNDGARDATVADQLTGIGARHAGYALNSARELGLIAEERRQYSVTPDGKALLATTAGSADERQAFRNAVTQSRIVATVAPGLLGDVAPTAEDIAKVIRDHVDMSESTALRRASTFTSWRQQLLGPLAETLAEAVSPPAPPVAAAPADVTAESTATAPAAATAPLTGATTGTPATTATSSPATTIPISLPQAEAAAAAAEKTSTRSPFTMKPRQMRVRELAELKRDGKLFLPELQRGFVWDNARVRALHDSLYRRYPIGALLLWKPTWENDEAPFSTRPWDLCRPGPDGKGIPEPASKVPQGAVFVLDGQQRLTSLFRVIFQNRGRNKKTRDPDLHVALSSAPEWRKQPFHIHSTQLYRQLKDGLIIPAEILFAGVRGEGNESAAVQKAIAQWTKPGSDLSLQALDRANEIRNAVLNAEILGYEIDADVDDENVIEVFARLNQQGVRLRPSDLAAARLTGPMSTFRTRALESLTEREFHSFGGGEDMEEVVRTGGQVDTDIMVRTALFLATGLLRYSDIEKRRRDATDHGAYAKVEAHWDAAVAGLKRAVSILRNAGVVGGSWVPYRYVLLVPAIAAAKGKLHDEKWWLGWMITASLWGHYSGSAETVAQADALLAASGNYDALLEHIRKNAKRTGSILPDESDLTQNIVQSKGVHLAMLVNLVRRDGRSFPSGSRFADLQGELNIHHIFPRQHLDEDTDGTVAPDRIGNLTPLLQRDNTHLSDSPPADYLDSLVAGGKKNLLEDHEIPTDEALWEPERYPDFCEAREKALASMIHQLLSDLGMK